MKQNKRTAPAELSYYGLYLLDYLRKYHPDKVIDTEFITGREEAAAETFEKARLEGSSTEAAQEEENEFADEVAASDREAFCRKLFPYLKNLLGGYDTSDDTFALSPDHDLLYTELTGTVMLYLESYGIQ